MHMLVAHYYMYLLGTQPKKQNELAPCSLLLLSIIKKTESKFHRYRRIVEPVKHSSTDEGIKSQKGSGLGDLDYLEPYRIGTSGVKAIPNPYEN